MGAIDADTACGAARGAGRGSTRDRRAAGCSLRTAWRSRAARSRKRLGAVSWRAWPDRRRDGRRSNARRTRAPAALPAAAASSTLGEHRVGRQSREFAVDDHLHRRWLLGGRVERQPGDRGRNVNVGETVAVEEGLLVGDEKFDPADDVDIAVVADGQHRPVGARDGGGDALAKLGRAEERRRIGRVVAERTFGRRAAPHRRPRAAARPAPSGCALRAVRAGRSAAAGPSRPWRCLDRRAGSMRGRTTGRACGLHAIRRRGNASPDRSRASRCRDRRRGKR